MEAILFYTIGILTFLHITGKFWEAFTEVVQDFQYETLLSTASQGVLIITLGVLGILSSTALVLLSADLITALSDLCNTQN